MAAVVFGQELDHERQYGMATAIGASVVAGNAGPALAYLETLAYEQRLAFARNAEGAYRRVANDLSQEFLRTAFHDALNGNFRMHRINNAEVQVGFAAYNHWKRIVVDYPEWKNNRIERSRHEQRISLPNTHHPYFRVRIIVANSQTNRPAPSVSWQSFDHQTGRFVKAANIWQEFQNGRHLVNFQELGRTDSYIDLLDPSRQLTVRLHADKAFWKQPGTGWNLIYHGRSR